MKLFFSPWISGNALAPSLEVLRVSDLITFLAGLSYLDSFNQLIVSVGGKDIYPSTGKEKNPVIATDDPLNLLVSANKHKINQSTVIPGTLQNMVRA